MVSDEMSWRSRAYDRGSLSWHAQQFGLLLERQGLAITEGGDLVGRGVLGWGEVVQAFADVWDASVTENNRLRREKEADLFADKPPMATPEHWAARLYTQIQQGPRSISSLTDEFRAAMEAAVDQFIDERDEQAMRGDARDESSEAPEDTQGQPNRHPAQSIIVHFNDGSERIIHTHHPMVSEGGWVPRMINGVPFLIIGHGVPRQMYPLHSVKSIDLSEELL